MRICNTRAPIVLFGAGGHSKVVLEAVTKAKKSIAYLLDSDATKNNQFLLGYEIKIYKEGVDLSAFEFIVTIGNDKVRKKWYEELSQRASAGIIIHPTAVVTDFCQIGAGTVVLGNANINPDTTVGENVIINTGAIVEHDCHIGNHVHIAPNATLCGGVIVGESTLIGANATILPGRKIGNNVVVGAGSVITEDIPNNAVVVGNPGKIIKSNF